MIQAIIQTLGAIGSGGETSPLSVESPFAELIRLVQVGIFAGVLYLVKSLKEAKSEGADSHSQMAQDISTIKGEVQVVRQEVSELKAK